MELKERDRKLLERLNKFPEIREDVEDLCRIAEAEEANVPRRADDAEEAIVEDVRKLGTKIMQRWAEGREKVESAAAFLSGDVKKHGKKKLNGTRRLA
jgi:predicted phage gp36 major capsid-like protein